MELIRCQYDKINEYLSGLKNSPEECYILSEKPNDMILVSLSADSKYKPEDIESPCKAVIASRTGGTIIGFKDSITIFQIHKLDIKHPIDDIKNMSELRCCVRDYLKSKGLNAEIIGNDIIVDNKYKVCGCNYTPFTKGYGILGMHISLNVDLDIIRKYCDKEMIKIPKGLSEYGLTREEIVDAIEEFISNKEK